MKTPLLPGFRFLLLLLLLSGAATNLFCAAGGNALGSPAKGETYPLGDSQFEVVAELNPRGLLEKFGPRFDLTMRVASIRVQGKNFLGTAGLVDEFGLKGVGVLGYDHASPGELFAKIGVGLLRRADQSAYRFNYRYPVERFFKAVVLTQSSRAIETSQRVRFNQFAYRYVKRYEVDPTQRRLSIQYALTNEGPATVVIEHYNHHWFRIQDVPIGSRYLFQSSFPLTAQNSKGWIRQGALMRTVSEKLVDTPAYYDQVETVPASSNRFFLTLEGLASVESVGDYPVSEFAFYADKEGLCPELFYRVEIKAGETAHWSRSYRFITER